MWCRAIHDLISISAKDRLDAVASSKQGRVEF
jgi:hypothetical protein